jgi:signal transduction histidine kinase
MLAPTAVQGVGLSVELHGGIVSAASEGPGQGSDFHVRFPLATQDH